MNRASMRCGLLSVYLLSMVGCAATATVTSLPQAVRRIAVLPPYYPGGPETSNDSIYQNGYQLRSQTVGDVLAQQARARLAAKGFDVVEPSVVKLETGGRAPTNIQTAAQIARDAKLDAAALYIEIRRWLPTPYETGMKADGVIVALDLTIVDPKTGAILWQVHRPSRPVPLYGVVLTGQGNVFVAEAVMQEIFAQLAPRQPTG